MVVGADAGEAINVPDSTAIALRELGASISVPSEGLRAFAGLDAWGPDFTVGTSDAGSSVPVHGGRALTEVGLSVEVLSSRAVKHAGSSVPDSANSAVNTDILRGLGSSSRAEADTSAVGSEGIAGAARALGSNEENVVEGEVLDEFGAAAENETKTEAVPFSGEDQLLSIVVDDEASDTIDAGITARNQASGSVEEDTASLGIEEMRARSHFQDLDGVVGDVADVDRIDLGCGGCGEYDSNSAAISRR